MHLFALSLVPNKGVNRSTTTALNRKSRRQIIAFMWVCGNSQKHRLMDKVQLCGVRQLPLAATFEGFIFGSLRPQHLFFFGVARASVCLWHQCL